MYICDADFLIQDNISVFVLGKLVIASLESGRPVNQISTVSTRRIRRTVQVKVVQLQVFEGSFKTFGNIFGTMLMVPQLSTSVSLENEYYLAGNPDLGPITTPILDSLTNLTFIAIDEGAIDQSISLVQSKFHCFTNFSLL